MYMAHKKSDSEVTGNTKPSRLRFRNVLFTSFQNELESKFIFNEDKMQYVVFQQEKCPSTGRLHYQGYIEFRTQIGITNVKKLLNDETVHLEKRMGTQKQAIAYCTKDETKVNGPWEYGSPNTQGKRTDLEQISEDIKNGEPIMNIVENNPSQYIRYHRGIEKLHELYQPIRDFKPEVFIYWGKAGSGKTRKAFSFPDCFFKPNGQWWDGYNHQETVIFDDYDGYINFREFLQLTDRYPHQVPIKGGYKQFNSKRIIFTSNINPSLWYYNEFMNEENKNAFDRRITLIEYFE